MTLPAVHSKAYVWLRDKKPVLAFIGSANYSQEAFMRRRELLAPNDPSAVARYYDSLLEHSVNCLDGSIANRIRMTEFQRKQPMHKAPRQVEAPPAAQTAVPENAESVTVPLLTKKGEVGSRSGLNWGQRPEYKRNPNQAYIPIPASIGRHSKFFPRRKLHFTVITDDGLSFDAVLAQDNNKALETPLDNGLLGRYFRKRLGLNDGTFIRAEDLHRYGRTNVEFQRISDDTYLMDFSAPPHILNR